MKKLLAIVISMAMLVAMMPMGVFADGGTPEESPSGETPVTEKVAKIGDIEYETLTAAVEAAEKSGEITRIVMTNSVSELDTINIENGNKITLDLNNKNIEFKADNYFKVENGQLELTGKGNVKSSYKSEYRSTIYMVGSAEDKADYSVVTVGPEVTIENVGSYGAGIVSAPKTDKAYGAKFVIKGIIKSTYGFTVNGSIKQTTGNIPKVIVSGTGKIEGPEGAAIYAAGYAEYIVEGKLEGKYFAIEIRAGKLTIADGATLVSTGDFSDPVPNGNGSTVTGATVAVSQHTTNLPIEVVINGGTVSSTGTNGYALYEIDTVKDEAKENIAKGVNVEVNNGNFSGKIHSTNNKLKITGGTFSTSPKSPTNYVVAGNNVYKLPNGTYVVAANRPSGYIWTAGTSDDDYDFIGTAIPYTPSTPTTDNVTNNTTDKNTTADLTPAVKDNKAETTVDAKTADKIVDKAVANKSTEVIVDAKGNNTVASSEVAIPEKTVKEISEKTDANLVIKTDNGQVDLDKTALAAVAEQAGTTGTVRLVVETVKTDENICHVDLKLITSNGAVKDFRGGNVKVTINLTKELAAKELVCVYIDDNGIYTLVEGVLNADGTYTFTTGHFSEYAVMAKDEADKKIAEQLDTMIKDVNLKVRTSKTSKKNIKAVVSGDVKAITDAGYTVKYKFYRSEKKASKYEAKATKAGKTYINTAGKKGTKYYYKAKALVYDGDKLVGQTVLKQCKYGVRTWSK